MAETWPRQLTTASMTSFPHEPASAFRARQALGRALVAAGVERGAADDALIVISELVSNSVRHAQPLPSGSVEVGWDVLLDAVVIEVADGGPRRGSGALELDIPPDEAGRGLFLVTALTAEVRVEREDDRSITRAVIRLAEQAEHRG